MSLGAMKHETRWDADSFKPQAQLRTRPGVTLDVASDTVFVKREKEVTKRSKRRLEMHQFH